MTYLHIYIHFWSQCRGCLHLFGPMGSRHLSDHPWRIIQEVQQPAPGEMGPTTFKTCRKVYAPDFKGSLLSNVREPKSREKSQIHFHRRTSLRQWTHGTRYTDCFRFEKMSMTMINKCHHLHSITCYRHIITNQSGSTLQKVWAATGRSLSCPTGKRSDGLKTGNAWRFPVEPKFDKMKLPPSGKRSHSCGKSPSLIGKWTVNGPSPIAMFDKLPDGKSLEFHPEMARCVASKSWQNQGLGMGNPLEAGRLGRQHLERCLNPQSSIHKKGATFPRLYRLRIWWMDLGLMVWIYGIKNKNWWIWTWTNNDWTTKSANLCMKTSVFWVANWIITICTLVICPRVCPRGFLKMEVLPNGFSMMNHPAILGYPHIPTISIDAEHPWPDVFRHRSPDPQIFPRVYRRDLQTWTCVLKRETNKSIGSIAIVVQ